MAKLKPMTHSSPPSHFRGKDAVGHVAEAQAQGIADSAEIHGVEIPGPISAACDAVRETALSLLFTWTLLSPFGLSTYDLVLFLAIFAAGWLFWKGGRSAWLGWSRLERLHRIVAQEKWEIEHNRPQEKSELKALYAAKGFEGKLLDDVIEVLMSDGDRLLKVMVEEELGLTLEVHEHPLKQGLWAFFGAFLGACFVLIGLFALPSYGVILGSFLAIGLAAYIAAKYEDNAFVPAIVWNLGLASVAYGFVYFLIEYVA